MEALVQFGVANAGAAALLAVFVALFTRLWRNPHIAHALWLIVLLRLIAPPLFQIPMHAPDWFARPSVTVSSRVAPDVLPVGPLSGVGSDARHLTPARAPVVAPAGAAPKTKTLVRPVARPEPVVPTPTTSTSPVPEPSISTPIRIADVLAVLWIAGTLLYAFLTGIRARRFARAVRRSHAPAPSWLQDEIFEIAQRIGLRRAPRLMVVEGALPPMVWSGWQPTLLVPQTIVESIDPSQRRLLLLHELLHIRRGDHLIRWFAISVLALYWWNPFAWWAVRRLQNAEEECCDAGVLFFHPQQSEIYGEALLAVTEFVSCGSLPAPAVSIGVERKNHLKRRMTMILKGSRWPKLSKTRSAVLIACGAVVLGVSIGAVAQVESSEETKASATKEPEKAQSAPHDQSVPTQRSAPSAALPVAPKVPVGVTTRPVPAKTAIAFLRDKPVEPLPGDDEIQRILKQRYSAAFRALLLCDYQYDVGTTSMGNLLAAARSVLEAKLALAKSSDDQVRARRDYLEFVTIYWRQAKAKLDIGGAAGFAPLDEAQAREAMFDAQLKLVQLPSNEKGKAPETTKAVLPELGGVAEFARSAPPPSVTSGPATAASASKTRPALLTAKSLEPAPGDDQLQKLLKDRYNSALKSLQGHYERTTLDTNVPITTVIVAAHPLLDAELAMATANDMVGIYERYLEFMKYLDDVAEKRRKSGSVGFDEFNAVHAARLDAEINFRQQRLSAEPSPREKSVRASASGAAPQEEHKLAFKEKPIPFVTDGPLQPIAGDNELQKLLKERYNAALSSLQQYYGAFRLRESPPATVMGAARGLLRAELALSAAPADQARARERYLEFIKVVESQSQRMAAAGQMRQADADDVRDVRLDVELNLMRAKFAPPSSQKLETVESPIHHLALQSLETRVRIAEAEVVGAHAAVGQSEAEFKRALVNLKYRQLQFDRLQSLRKQNAVSEGGMEDATHARDEATANVDAARSSIEAAKAQVSIKDAQLQQARFELDHAKALGAK